MFWHRRHAPPVSTGFASNLSVIVGVGRVSSFFCVWSRANAAETFWIEPWERKLLVWGEERHNKVAPGKI